MSPRVLNSVDGLATEVGFYFAGMEELREQLEEAVIGMADESVQRPALPGAHAIGALVLHIGEAEWYWMEMVVSGHKLTAEDRGMACWDVLENADSFPTKGYSAEFCLNEIKRIREQTKRKLATFTDADLDRIFSIERRGEIREQSLRWILHHLIDHEAQHKGQILMLKRLQMSNSN